MRVYGRHRERAGRGRLCAACALLLVPALCVGCGAGAPGTEHVLYEDPAGRFSLLLPEGWTVSASPDGELLSAMTPPGAGSADYDARVDVSLGPPPCDRSLIDDSVSWYADLLCWGEAVDELSRTETTVDGRRALVVDCLVESPEGKRSRRLSLVTEAYGVVWLVTCSVRNEDRYPEYESSFQAIQHSLDVRGAWPGMGN